MSNYSNFVSDFPRRCDDILDKFFPQAKVHDREVTLMLAVATAGFVIPFGRLREENHPARDRERFQQAAAKLDSILDARFLGSALWDNSPSSWVFAKEVEDECQDLELWPELATPKPLSKDKLARSVLAHLRNALAHGNIFTHGKPIDQLIFLSRPSEESPTYAMLAVAPLDFHKFLRKWFSFLTSLRMPVGLYEGAMVA